MKSRILVSIVMLALLALTLPFAISCSSGATETTSNPITGLQSDVSILKSDVSTLKSDVSSLKQSTSTDVTSRVTALEDSLGEVEQSLVEVEQSLSELEANDNTELSNTVASLVDDIQLLIEDIAEIKAIDSTQGANITELDTRVTDLEAESGDNGNNTELESQVADLEDSVEAILADIVALEVQITAIENSIEAVQVSIDDIDSELEIASDAMSLMEDRLTALEIKQGAEITYIGGGQVWFKPLVTGNYAVRLTIYGIGITGISQIGTPLAVSEYESSFGSGSMYVVVFSSSNTSASWKTSDLVRLSITATEIDFAEIGVVER